MRQNKSILWYHSNKNHHKITEYIVKHLSSQKLLNEYSEWQFSQTLKLLVKIYVRYVHKSDSSICINHNLCKKNITLLIAISTFLLILWLFKGLLLLYFLFIISKLFTLDLLGLFLLLRFISQSTTPSCLLQPQV